MSITTFLEANTAAANVQAEGLHVQHLAVAEAAKPTVLETIKKRFPLFWEKCSNALNDAPATYWRNNLAPGIEFEDYLFVIWRDSAASRLSIIKDGREVAYVSLFGTQLLDNELAVKLQHLDEKIEIKFVYFLESGKFYHSEIGYFTKKLFGNCFNPASVGRELNKLRMLPGLQRGQWAGPFTIEFQDFKIGNRVLNGYPELVTQAT